MLSAFKNYDLKTIILYILIIIFATALGFMSQSAFIIKKNSDNMLSVNKRFIKLPFILSFILLEFFACFTAVGADRTTYGELFLNISFETIIDGWQEPGFNFFMFVVKIFTKEPAIFLAIMSFLTILFVYKGLWDCRNELSLGLAIFIFSSQYYLQSFNLMRMYFAMSILIAGIKLIKRKQYYKYSLLLLAGCLIHYSVLIVIFAFILALIYNKLKNVNLEIKVLFTLLAIIIFLASFSKILSVIMSFNNPIINKYLSYLSNVSATDIGLKWIFNILPYLLIFYLFKLFGTEYKQYRGIALGFFFVSLVISIMSYFVPVLGRALTLLNLPILIILPSMLCKAQKSILLYKHEKNYKAIYDLETKLNLIYFLVIAYFIFALFLYLAEYVKLDEIDNFRFIWNNYLWS